MTSAIVLPNTAESDKTETIWNPYEGYTKVAQFALNFISCNTEFVIIASPILLLREANEINVTTCKTESLTSLLKSHGWSR